MNVDLPYEDRLALVKKINGNTKELFVNPKGRAVDNNNIVVAQHLRVGTTRSSVR